MKWMCVSMIFFAKTAQIKMMESIAVLGVFFVLLVMGLVFYGKYQAVSVKQAGSESFDKDAIRIVEMISYLPEMQCSTDAVTEFNCYDRYKIDGLAQTIQGTKIDNSDGIISYIETDTSKVVKQYYFSTFGFSSIKIIEVFPQDTSLNPTVIYDFPPAQKINGIDQVKGNGVSYTRVPISLFDPVLRTYSFAYLEVGMYRR